MPKKATKPWTIAPLQRIVGEPITDPAEQAAIDKMRQRHRRKRGQKTRANHRPGSDGA
jgi:hypothetical protein